MSSLELAESQLVSFIPAISVGLQIDRSQAYRHGRLSGLSGPSLGVLEVLKQVHEAQRILIASVHGSWPSLPVELTRERSGNTE